MYKKKKYKEGKVDSRNKKKGRAHLCTEWKGVPKPKPDKGKKTPALV